jgi:predicted Ser/Thr protein kinase
MLAAGARLGPYKVLSAIGAGGMGEVYKASDTRLDRTVAIKVLLTALASDPQFRERFDREARIISQLDHPHICTLYDVGEQDGTSFLVMAYLEGETLEARLKKGALSLDRALQYAIQIADALNRAHRAGIAHRDLKPGNIMLTKTGATLLDFGLAKAGGPVGGAPGLSMLPTTPPGLTAHGTILGTFQYMAPEQLEGHEADARTDIFAFGAIVYEMITGKKAFEGKSQASLIAAILEREPPPVSSQQPLVPQTLDRVIRRCLAKDPDERWQTASDLSIELQWIAEAAPAPASGQTSAGTSVRWWRMFSLGLLVLAAAGWGVAVRRWRPAPAPSEPVVFSVAPPDGATFATPGGLPGGLPWIALSPDGRLLAFVALSADGRQQVWTRPLAAAIAHPVTGTDGGQAPFWSPDSRSLAFFARGKLKVVDAAGGTTQIVADAPGLYGRGVGTATTRSFSRPRQAPTTVCGKCMSVPLTPANWSRILIEPRDSEGISRHNFFRTVATFSSESAVARMRRRGSARSTAVSRACSFVLKPWRITPSLGICSLNAARCSRNALRGPICGSWAIPYVSPTRLWGPA